MSDQPPKNVKVRLATAADVDIVAEFSIACGLDSEGIKLDRKTVHKGAQIMLENSAKGFYFLLEADGEAAAQLMITFEWSDWRAADIWWIQSVYVKPSHRRKGYYRALYNHVKSEAAKAGAAGVRLYADADNQKAQTTLSTLAAADLSISEMRKTMKSV